VWDDKTKDLVEAGKLSVFGVLEEQHPVRADLFAQWKGLNFPMLADPLNILDVAVVPIHLLVDGDGVIRYRNPGATELKAFMKADYSGGKKALVPKGSNYMKGDVLAMKGDLDGALKVYDSLKDEGGRLHFRKGVVWRMKFDEGGSPKDFERAVGEWSAVYLA